MSLRTLTNPGSTRTTPGLSAEAGWCSGLPILDKTSCAAYAHESSPHCGSFLKRVTTLQTCLVNVLILSCAPTASSFSSRSLSHHADVHRQTEDGRGVAPLRSHSLSTSCQKQLAFPHCERFSPNCNSPPPSKGAHVLTVDFILVH